MPTVTPRKLARVAASVAPEDRVREGFRTAVRAASSSLPGPHSLVARNAGHGVVAPAEAGLIPVVAIETAVLHGFRDVFGQEPLGAIQIGNGARHLQDAIVSPGGESQPAHGHLESAFA